MADSQRTEKRNTNLMHLIKRMHGAVENTDIEKHRQSQDHFGALLGNSKDVLIEEIEIKNLIQGSKEQESRVIHGEWIYVNRAHMKKYIIL